MRFLNRIYAAVFGYFWLPCPLCGRMFGGHEATFTAVLCEGGHAYCVCPDPRCQSYAKVQEKLGYPTKHKRAQA